MEQIKRIKNIHIKCQLLKQGPDPNKVPNIGKIIYIPNCKISLASFVLHIKYVFLYFFAYNPKRNLHG